MQPAVTRVVPDASTAEALASIHAAAFSDRNRWSPAEFLSHGSAPGVLMFADPDLGAGLLVLRCVVDEAEILTIGVAPAARRRGLAQALLHAGIDGLRARGVEKLFLEVADDNVAAIALYKVKGFAETGRRAGYYRNPDGTRTDALILARSV